MIILIFFPNFIFYSQKLNDKQISKIYSFQYSEYKVLEKNEKFIIVEYPQKKKIIFIP